MRLSAVCFMLLAASALLPGPVLGDEGSEKQGPPVIRVQGEATVSVVPDQVSMEVGIINEAKTAEAAAARNAKNMKGLIKNLKDILGSRGEIKTSAYSVRPVYKTEKKSGKRSLEGFSATNTIQIRTEDLSVLGRLVDAATDSGANRVDRLEFSSKDPSVPRNAALKIASRKAGTKAEAMADSLGVRIIRVLRAEEIPTERLDGNVKFRSAVADAGTVPLEPGMIEVRALVELTVEIGAGK
ncbi:MAG TPA: SIMPL domain-containing protein [Nitrospiria bacterium]